MNVLFLALLLGVVAGLRTMTPLAAVSWAARLNMLSVHNTFLAFLGYQWTPWILTLAAVGEIINDKLPRTPSRKVPPQFIARVVSGTISGGASARTNLVKAIGGNDLPIALLEDAVAVLAAIFIVRSA